MIGEMDLLSTCEEQLKYFRIKELKDVLTQLGLAKQGKKQELIDRVLLLLSDEPASKSRTLTKRNPIGKDEVAKIINDTYRKMQLPGASDLASKGQSSSDIGHVKPKEEVVDSYHLHTKVSCPCGSSLLTESMIQCEDSRCKVWQHIDCVIIPEKPMEGIQPEVPVSFYCELCRLSRADPFWVTVSHPLRPVKMLSCSIAPDGSNMIQCLEKTYNLSRVEKEMLQKNDYDLQAWCILLNDKVPFRMQWPLHTDLQVNGVTLRTTNRPGQQVLGINGRDAGALITTCSREGPNKIALSRRDTRTFVFGIRIAKQRTVQQVLNMVPKEADGERFEDALARVCRCFHGGNGTDNADSDSDIEVVADFVTVNLRCPNSGSRMKIAGRFKPCLHVACFDLETFVELNQRSRKWQCPTCSKNYSLENLIIDPYFNHITSLMRICGEDVNEIDVKADGSWRAKIEGGCKDLAKWHLPDGSLCETVVREVKCDLGILKQIKEEDISEGQRGLKLGIRKNQNGVWELSKPEDTKPPLSGNHVHENFGNPFQNIAMSSSATGSYRDGEDHSVNQDGGGNFDFALNNVHDLDPISLKFDPTYNIDNGIPAEPSKEADVIVLSDSDEEDNVTMISANDGTEILYPANQTEFAGTYSEDDALRAGGTSCLGPFNNETDEFGIPLWPPYQQTGSSFQLFDADAGGSDALVDMQQSSLSPLDGYGFTSNNDPGGTSQAQDFSICPSNAEVNESLVDNPLAYGSEDPSLQIFLPSQSADVPPQPDVSDHAEMANASGLDNWISLSLGGAEGGPVYSASTNGLKSKQQFTAQENDTAASPLSMNGARSRKSTPNGRRSEGPFSHPRQPRSVRPRTFFSIEDTDSD